jgi:hypothetical protein
MQSPCCGRRLDPPLWTVVPNKALSLSLSEYHGQREPEGASRSTDIYISHLFGPGTTVLIDPVFGSLFGSMY